MHIPVPPTCSVPSYEVVSVAYRTGQHWLAALKQFTALHPGLTSITISGGKGRNAICCSRVPRRCVRDIDASCSLGARQSPGLEGWGHTITNSRSISMQLQCAEKAPIMAKQPPSLASPHWDIARNSTIDSIPRAHENGSTFLFFFASPLDQVEILHSWLE